MYSVSNSDFLQAVRLLKELSSYPGRNRREKETIRKVYLLAKRWAKKVERHEGIH